MRGLRPLSTPSQPNLTEENEIAALGPMTTDDIQSARPSAFSCPSCHGVLFALNGDPAPRYRYRARDEQSRYG